MRHDEISEELKESSFEYFYWFSRFEFVLKENGFLKSEDQGAKAEPSWGKFKDKFKDQYNASSEAKALIDLHPKRQVVSVGRSLEWIPVGLDHCTNELCKVITMLCTIRNNLFHGGKHGDFEVDDKQRNLSLLHQAKLVLDQLATQFGYNDDYTRTY